MFYRVRTMLNELMPTAGHDWIVRCNGSYCWNGEVEVVLDTEQFESLCRAAAETADGAEQLALYREAIGLYGGDFLPKLSMEPWVMPISAYYHRLYLDAVEAALELLQAEERWEDMIALCERALSIEPYSETVYCHYLRALIAVGRRREAVQAYEEMSEALFAAFGVMPSDECRALYREASREVGAPTVPTDTIRDSLSEKESGRGAMQCEYDFFKLVYQMQARSIGRSGEVIHIALFSLHGYRGKELSRRSIDVAMSNLEELLLANLRQGDHTLMHRQRLLVFRLQASGQSTIHRRSIAMPQHQRRIPFLRFADDAQRQVRHCDKGIAAHHHLIRVQPQIARGGSHGLRGKEIHFQQIQAGSHLSATQGIQIQCNLAFAHKRI
jgi:DNA-binding SARP family transcriptional activator